MCAQTLLEILPGLGTTIPGPFEGESQFGASSGYGTDPNLVTPHSTWPLTLTLYERHFLVALSDIILPASADAPAPSEIRIDDFFDDWLSAPYQQQSDDKTKILAGLDQLNGIAWAMFKNDFILLSSGNKRKAVDELTRDAIGVKFFVRFRSLLLGAYFTSDEGMRALGYRGNVPLRKPAQISNEAHRIIEKELKKLGL